LLLTVNDVPGSVRPPRPARRLELELALGVGHHDEAALGLGDVERRVDHERQHLVEHAARPEGAQPVEDGGHLRQVAGVGGRRTKHRRGVLVGQEDDLDVVAVTQADGVAVKQRAFRNLLAVDERPVARRAVPQQIAPGIVADDLGVLA
jgi:hypothetical protein